MPFAKAGRFVNPRLVNAQQDKLEGIQDATKYGDACPQSQFTGVTSSTEVSLDSGRTSSVHSCSPSAQVNGLIQIIEQLAFEPIGN
jgi:hypothetical protein